MDNIIIFSNTTESNRSTDLIQIINILQQENMKFFLEKS